MSDKSSQEMGKRSFHTWLIHQEEILTLNINVLDTVMPSFIKHTLQYVKAQINLKKAIVDSSVLHMH